MADDRDETTGPAAEPAPEPKTESSAGARAPRRPPGPGEDPADAQPPPGNQQQKPSTGPWRTGVSWLAFALLAAAGARLALPDHDAGMLRVRSKVLDAGILIVMGVAILFLAGTIPDQPV